MFGCICLFIYLEQKVYYIVNTLLSPMHRQLSRMIYQERLSNDFHWGPSTISPKGQDVIQESLCLFIYLEQKVYYIVNTLLSPMHRQLSRIKYQDRLFIGVLFQLAQDVFQESLDITQSKKIFY